MGKKTLQCLFIGESTEVYRNLVKLLNSFNLNLQVRRVDAEKHLIIRALKRQRVASLVFIAENVPFSLELLSDLSWQYSEDSIVTVLTKQNIDNSLKSVRRKRFSKFHYIEDYSGTRLHLQYLMQTAQLKWEFRHCKRLLGLSEKRSQWLVDSSHQAVAFILRDLHLYANTAYQGLFDIDSIYELPSIPLQKIFVDDEYALFQSYVKKQIKSPEINRSLVISLRKRNGRVFRASVYVIPSVFKGRKCMQLWIRPLNLSVQNDEYENDLEQMEDHSKQVSATVIKNPKMNKRKKYTAATLLKNIIKRKEATISAQQLIDMQSIDNDEAASHILSLTVPAAQRTGIDNLLSDLGGANIEDKRQIFWDKVKLIRLLQILIKKKSLKVMLFIRLSKVAVSDPEFNELLKSGLKKVGSKSSNLTFLLPSQVNDENKKDFLHLVSMLRSFDCQVALDDFSVSGDSLYLLKQLRPDSVSLSLTWVRQIEGNEKRELALASFIRQLEAKNIRVIAPCGFSNDMKKLFALSGVSFCQERTLKTA